jgi:DNA polymerase I-like protein with 3'-5' exonuclease and polymerase domains
MIYFITNNVENYKKSFNNVFTDIIILPEKQGKQLYYQILGKIKVQALDLEATGLDAYIAQPLLYGLGNKQHQFMFDWTINITDIIEHISKHKIITLGHNIKYDIKLIKTNTNILLTRLYDTMVCDQRLWMKSGYGWSYEELVRRYCNTVVVKSIRNEFIDVNIETFKINPSHLYYLKGDLVNLFDIRKKQRAFIKKFKMELLIYGIEFPLISIIATAELEGFVLNKEKWLNRLQKEKDRKLEIECKLDDIVRELRDFKSHHKLFKDIDPKVILGGSKYNNSRKHNPDYDIFNADGTTTEINLFGEIASHKDITGVKKKVNFIPNNINYNSSKDVIFIFAGLEEPLIVSGTENFEVPKLNTKLQIIGGVNRYTLNGDLLEKYLLLKPDSIMKEFIELKIEHAQLITAIGTFGESFINKLNKVTGKIHTTFRQAFAATGRLQSGGGKREPDKVNFQNIPSNPEYRQAFTVDENYSVTTADYSGAELIVMASHAQDFRLIELSNSDMHSHMATKCWRNIYNYRVGQLFKLFSKSPTYKTPTLLTEYDKNRALSKEFTVTKANKDLRTQFKPMTFGCIYGMYPKKAGTSLNVIKEEGKVVIDTIKGEIPLTFEMVERASAEAKAKGFVILNDRTNARAWFPTLIQLLQGKIKEDDNFIKISGEQSEARNIRIQGTQADFVKEATIILVKHFIKLKLDITILSWVHDEIVFKVPRYLDGRSDEYNDYINKQKLTLTSSLTGKQYNNTQDLIKDIMINVANRYLKNVTIDVEIETHDYWTK